MDKIKKWLKWLYTAPRMPKEIKNKPLRIILLICGWAIIALLPVYCLGMVEYIHYASKAKVFTFFTERTEVVLFDLAVLYLLWFCALCVLKKGWLATVVYGGFFGAVATTDYLKYSMTGDYFYPWDLAEQAGHLGELKNFITVPFPVLYIAMILFVFVMAVIVFFSGAQLPVRWCVRYPALAVVVVCMAVSVSTPEKVTRLLNKNALYLEDMALQTSNYQANGFVGAFTINILSSNIQKPDNYSEDAVDALLDGYTEQDKSDNFSSPDIILVLSESFWDPTLLPGTTFSADPLENYREIASRENTISGRFFTTGLGGGTVRPEFEVLTGLSTDYLPSGCVPWQYILEDTDSYVSVYKGLGYKTMAVHPYTSSFYNRKAAYPKIGIDELHFDDDIYALGEELGLTIRGRQISDDTFASAIEYYLDKNSDSPVFLFGISMENHQPYPDKFETPDIEVKNDAFDESTANAVTNFTTGIADADKCLKRLVDYIDSRDRDTILVWFGDHLPTLGGNMAAYRQSGMIGAEYDEESYEKIYSTPFIVYANFDLGDSDVLHKGTDNNITSYNLMNGVAELIGSPRTPYMEYLEDYARALPYYNIRLHKTITDDQRKWVDGHRLLTYDRVAGGKYSMK